MCFKVKVMHHFSKTLASMNFIIANYETILTFPREQTRKLEGQGDINCWARIRYTVASKISHISLTAKAVL